MSLGQLVRIWRRRFILTTALLLMALAATAAVVQKFPRTYQSTSSVVLLASKATARLSGNPYLAFSPSLTLTADVLSRELMAPRTVRDLAASGVPGTYTVALAPYTTPTTGSVLVATVTGTQKNTVERALYTVTGEIGVELSRMQASVAPRNRIRAETIFLAPQAALSVSQTARLMVPVIAVALLLAFGIPVVVDGRRVRRQLRTGPLLPDGNHRPADEMVNSTLRN